MRGMVKMAVLGLAAYGGKVLYDQQVRPRLAERGDGGPTGSAGATGWDTPTGTDPDAKYTEPGFQDVSFGQAVDRDMQLADRLLEETGGDRRAAASRFEREATGAPTLARQQSEAEASGGEDAERGGEEPSRRVEAPHEHFPPASSA